MDSDSQRMESNDSLHIVEKLAEDFFERVEKGETITPQQFAAQFSEHELTLRNFIEAMLLVRDMHTDGDPEPKMAPGAHIGHYEIVREIGRGGMGVVFVAKDRRLDRKVALKLLSNDSVSDSDWLVRFNREAKLASSLNHPNILTIHEVGNDNNRHFIATEFVDGITLLEAIQSGTATLEQTIVYATQLMSAVAAAHEAGIVHRDLKPENIMVRHDGLVKVLDFGLAKVAIARQKTPSPGHESTTSPGVVLGTVHYMSPEQARGLPVETSSDIFSFGILFYVMLTGTHPFAGETTSDVMASIINQSPRPFSSLDVDVPLQVRQLLLACLEKEPAKRPTAAKLLAKLKELPLASDSSSGALPGAGSFLGADHTTARQVTASNSTRVANICYARSGNVNIAWQTLGNGPIDLVFVMGWVSHLEWFWKEPSFAAFLQRLATFSRVILFDKRGTGLSDKVPINELPTLEQRMDDVRAVMEAAGSKRAVLCGVSEGGPLCTLFAATYPEKTIAITMIGSYARRLWAADYPWGPTAEQREIFLAEIEQNWGGPLGIEDRAPSKADDPDFREWWASYLRMGASPGAAVALTRMNAQIDVRSILPTIQVPTLVIHRAGDRCLLLEEGQYLASQIPAAKFVELPGDDHLPFVGNSEAILDEIEEFLTGKRQAIEVNRVLTTVVYIRASTNAEANEKSRKILARFAGMVEREAALFQGANFVHDVDARDIDAHDANSMMLTFNGPARAVRAARAIRQLANRSQLGMQCGVHTDLCEIDDGKVLGPALELARELASEARAGDVLISEAVKNLVSGAGLEFTELETNRSSGLLLAFRLVE